MPITINTYCNVNRNGSININTDPRFFNPDNFACVRVGNDEPTTLPDGTYEIYDNITVQGVTRPAYAGPNNYGIIIVSRVGGPTWRVTFDNNTVSVYTGTTQPAPNYPWQETSWTGGEVLITRAFCI
jgi:hypothetical protein